MDYPEWLGMALEVAHAAMKPSPNDIETAVVHVPGLGPINTIRARCEEGDMIYVEPVLGQQRVIACVKDGQGWRVHAEINMPGGTDMAHMADVLRKGRQDLLRKN